MSTKALRKTTLCWRNAVCMLWMLKCGLQSLADSWQTNWNQVIPKVDPTFVVLIRSPSLSSILGHFDTSTNLQWGLSSWLNDRKRNRENAHWPILIKWKHTNSLQTGLNKFSAYHAPFKICVLFCFDVAVLWCCISMHFDSCSWASSPFGSLVHDSWGHTAPVLSPAPSASERDSSQMPYASRSPSMVHASSNRHLGLF